MPVERGRTWAERQKGEAWLAASAKGKETVEALTHEPAQIKGRVMGEHEGIEGIFAAVQRPALMYQASEEGQLTLRAGAHRSQPVACYHYATYRGATNNFSKTDTTGDDRAD